LVVIYPYLWTAKVTSARTASHRPIEKKRKKITQERERIGWPLVGAVIASRVFIDEGRRLDRACPAAKDAGRRRR
jgi:hypothetical protein